MPAGEAAPNSGHTGNVYHDVPPEHWVEHWVKLFWLLAKTGVAVLLATVAYIMAYAAFRSVNAPFEVLLTGLLTASVCFGTLGLPVVIGKLSIPTLLKGF